MENNFGGRLSYAMSLRGMRQKELAKAADVTEATVSRYVNNKRSPDIDFIRVVVKILDVSADYLLGFSDTTQINQASNNTSRTEAKYTLVNKDGVKILIKDPAQISLLDHLFTSLTT